MPDEVPSLCFPIRETEIPALLVVNRRIEYSRDGEWHPETDAVEEAVYQLVNAAYESGRLWQFTSTNHWHDQILADIAEEVGFDLTFLESFYSLLGRRELAAARDGLHAVAVRLREDRTSLSVRHNADWPDLLRQLATDDLFAGAVVSRDVHEWTTPNPFGSYLLSLSAAIDEALAEDGYVVWYPTHP
jgi:hypothetical protein